jgi:hypothetical protein
MAKHVLSLDVIESMNCDILRIDDTSVYAEDLPVECPILNITTPGANYSVELGEQQIQPGFRINATACLLELQTTGCGTEFKCLPDGIYVLKYSVSPNDKVYVEYNHLRTCKLRNRYDKILCELDLSDCEPDSETEKKLALLKKIDMYIKAAKAKVEICHEPAKGMQLYTYAKKLLDKFLCTSCQ